MMPLASGVGAAPLPVSASSVVPVGPIIPGLLELDQLSLLVGTTVVVLTIVLVLCSPATGQAFRYTALAVFFVLVAVGTLAAVNVLAFFVGWELTALFAWGLGRLADDSHDEGVAPFSAAGALASLLMFGGLLMLAVESRTVSLSGLKIAEAGPLALVVLVAILLKSFGVLSESWQRAGSGRFSLASASLAGTSLLVVGFYPILRLLGPATARGAGWQEPAVVLAGGLAILAALAALGQQDVPRALGYGAFSQFCAFVFAVAVGLDRATQGALYGLVTYPLAITGLLLCAGLIESATGQRELQWVGGAAQRLPAVAVLSALCVAALAGLPPFGGFIAVGLVGTALWQQATPVQAALWAVLEVLTALYLARLFGRLFLGELRGPMRAKAPRSVLGAVVLLVAGLALAGLAPDQVMAFVRPALTMLTG
jgi:multicomponent Na+:H+ antiporter subunit A